MHTLLSTSLVHKQNTDIMLWKGLEYKSTRNTEQLRFMGIQWNEEKVEKKVEKYVYKSRRVSGFNH